MTGIGRTAYVANRLIPESKFKETTYKQSGAKVKDIMQAIMKMDNIAFEDTEAYSQQFDFTNYEDFRRLWDITRHKIRYVLDKAGMEVIKSPSATWWSGYGDCKSKSLFIGSILKNRDVEYFYRLCHYGVPSQAHVYSVAVTPEFGEVILDSVYHRFDEEERYTWKVDYQPSTGEIFNQVGKLSKEWSFLKILGISFLAFMGLKLAFNH